MRVICLVNNYLGWKALEFLSSQEEVVAVVVHPSQRASLNEEILKSAKAAGAEVFAAEEIKNASVLEKIARLKPDLGLSVMFGYLLKRNFLSLLPKGCLNLHPAYLPFNRGAYPNVWSIIEDTPAGVTLHFIDDGIDTGDIVRQVEVPVLSSDTGESLYHKLEAAGLLLLRDTWPSVQTGQVMRMPQRREEGTFHKVRDVEEIDEIHLDRSYKAENLLNLLRARTFPPHPGAYFRENGKKVYVRVQFVVEDEGAGSGE